MIYSIAYFVAGYIVRHLAGVIYDRVFSKRRAALNGVEQFMSSEVGAEIVVSFDGGKQFYQRTQTGWAKVNHEYIQSLIK